MNAHHLSIPQNRQKVNTPLPKAKPSTSSAFTIVELLIVIVVIAILAAITIISYNGISNRAKLSSLKTELSQSAKKLESEKVISGTDTYPGSTSAAGITQPKSVTYTYQSTGSTYCLEGKYETYTYHVSNTDTSPTEGACPAQAATMQTFTSTNCAALSVYNGSNESAIISLTDSRGGTTRTYKVAKLADNKCWMLDNLKLGSTTGSITLTPSDSNVATNFTLPQLYSGSDGSYASYDNPQAFGPVPGDTGSGETNYGYLYNWPAATAGETQTSMPAGSGNANNSICAKGWRLSTGGNTSSDFATLDKAFGGTGEFYSGFSYHDNTTITLASYHQAKLAAAGDSLSKWQYSGPFNGVYSGGWWNGFGGQGSDGVGFWWSRSAYPDDSSSAFYAWVNSYGLYPGDGYNYRAYGLAVRCLLN